LRGRFEQQKGKGKKQKANGKEKSDGQNHFEQND
jgi:hypothetical protein